MTWLATIYWTRLDHLSHIGGATVSDVAGIPAGGDLAVLMRNPVVIKGGSWP